MFLFWRLGEARRFILPRFFYFKGESNSPKPQVYLQYRTKVRTTQWHGGIELCNGRPKPDFYTVRSKTFCIRTYPDWNKTRNRGAYCRPCPACLAVIQQGVALNGGNRQFITAFVFGMAGMALNPAYAVRVFFQQLQQFIP